MSSFSSLSSSSGTPLNIVSCRVSQPSGKLSSRSKCVAGVRNWFFFFRRSDLKPQENNNPGGLAGCKRIGQRLQCIGSDSCLCAKNLAETQVQAGPTPSVRFPKPLPANEQMTGRVLTTLLTACSLGLLTGAAAERPCPADSAGRGQRHNRRHRRCAPKGAELLGACTLLGTGFRSSPAPPQGCILRRA